MSGLALRSWFGQSSRSQALVKAPSMDLIKSDTAPEIPEPVEIRCELSPEQFEEYIKSTDNTKYLYGELARESLCHLLVSLGCKQYALRDVESFRNKLEIYLKKKERKMLILTQRIVSYEIYKDFLPPRVVNRVTKIMDKFVDHSKLSFTIISFYGIYTGLSSGDIKEKINIFFLRVGIVNTDLDKNVVIDAWRGPTFSDEEAKI